MTGPENREQRQPGRTIPVVVAGAVGRMGEAVSSAVLADPGLELSGLIVLPDDPAAGTRPYPGGPEAGSDLAAVLDRGQVLIEFTTPEATTALARAAANAGCALVSGTTGLGEEAQDAMAAAARTVAVVHAPNMSRGVTLLSELATRAATVLGDFELEIEERHHSRKVDAPSGTALALASALASARGLGPDALRQGRSGRGLRTQEEIGIHALRGGDWIGEHTIFLAGPGETIELRHRAESRSAFVSGALAAARFAAEAPPGRYGMAEVLAAAGG
jgi:4-hydroxy-tetrahydrodipicolinate reductase